jgi:selT/selW/selH-like putative selenoprotein
VCPANLKRTPKTWQPYIQTQFGLADEKIELIPSNKIGTFEVIIDGELIYSKNKSGRLPHPDEIIDLIFLNHKG